MGHHSTHTTVSSRRDFLRWLAASPLLATIPGCARASAGSGPGDPGAAPPAAVPAPTLEDLVTTAGDALDVFDMEKVAETTVPPAHFGYIQTGVDGEETQRNNRAALERMFIRARRLIDVSRIDTRVTLFGREWPTPIVIAPCGSQRGFHAEGELATARAAQAREHLQALSTVSSTGVEDVNEARGEPVWYQLYATSNWDVTQAVVERVHTAGCPVIVLTVDLPGGSNRLTLARWSRTDDRTCTSCHRPRGRAPTVKPMFQGTSYRPGDFRTPGMTWDFIGRLREITDQRIVVKGLMTHEDATLALDHGVDGIWVSNHGGRAEGSGQATIDALPEIASVVAGRVPVIVDGGFRRGSDIFKGIARGADAVAVGRPYLWGLGAFGQAGVERVLEILSDELRITMRLAGTPSLSSIVESSVGTG
ncbi:MAG: alpha-hydroxy acid oxidase [Gemmatimonadota bacterium]|nr:alpha-hydroxy acid oxidase [Gemmatimonadota bacterium]